MRVPQNHKQIKGHPYAGPPRKGVYPASDSRNGKSTGWKAVIMLKGSSKTYGLGVFSTEADATKARDDYIEKLRKMGIKVDVA